MKIIDNFPKLKRDDIINITNDPVVGNLQDVRVLGVWYPNKGDKWSESEEMKRIGYLNSNPNKPFPQIVLITKEKRYLRIFGDDAKYITNIRQKQN